MKRPIAHAVVLLSLLVVPPVLAASGPEPNAPKYDFSARAAGIEAMVRADRLRERTLLTVPARAPQATTTKKSFWKTPWPYLLIGGGAVIAGVLVANSGEGNGY